jgi:hypothetical protein
MRTKKVCAQVKDLQILIAARKCALPLTVSFRRLTGAEVLRVYGADVAGNVVSVKTETDEQIPYSLSELTEIAVFVDARGCPVFLHDCDSDPAQHASDVSVLRDGGSPSSWERAMGATTASLPSGDIHDEGPFSIGDDLGIVAEILKDFREAEEHDARLATKAYAHLHDVTHGATGGDWSWEGEIQGAHSLYHPDNLDQLELEGRKRKKQEPTKAQESKDLKPCPTMEASEASAASRNDGDTDSEPADLARFNCREDHSWFRDYLPALEAREREAERVASDSKRTAA